MENNKTTRSKSSARKDPDVLPGGNGSNLVNNPRGAENSAPKGAEINIIAPTSDPPESDGEESVDLIAKNPILSIETMKDVITNTSVPPEEDLAAERSYVWTKMKEAQASGDKVLAKILLKAYNDLEPIVVEGPPKLTRSISALPVMTHLSEETAPLKVMAETETELEDNLVYAVGAVTSHQDIGFTPYFDENIKKLKAPLPLTIFDREWQKKALTAHLMLKPSKSSDDKAYRGLAYNDEWTQSHSAWTNNHRSFYITLRDVYNKGIFAEKLRIHKENCDAISDVYGFMTAFRYDMQIRMNAFAHRLPSKDGAAIPDISVKQSVVVEQCYSIVRSYGEASWKDNLYAPGSSHAAYDPDTGAKRPELMKSISYPSNQQHQNTAFSGRGNHQERRKDKRWNNQNIGWGQSYNYFNHGADHHHPTYGNYSNNHYNNPVLHGPGNTFQDFNQNHQYNRGNNPGYNGGNNPGYSGGSHMSISGDSRKHFRGGGNNSHEGGEKGPGGKSSDQSGGKQ
ncbi:hypothetical protein PGT21_033545 [Puccinia graminis f. sp. tritici]|uniref:Uncharacterized protein n=1 Tax=Puccinia graminis f. sp. tritici TaxID=56615 RepID=A0A5B0MGK4_PUCGR|nr:hypothetical protein PGTUg99_035072 [Puccinia graminis f. sp. tritici]KAA1091428.1 hypothetical protein PGT21_033545 [Puccinia graminis f. sp. tritici]